MARQSAAAFGRLPTVLAILHAHPSGLPLTEIAEEVGVDPAVLREEILAFYRTDLLGVRPDVIEFLAGDGQEADPADAPILRVVSDRPVAELGIEFLPADRWLQLFRAAQALSETEPGNTALEEVVQIIRGRILAGVSGPVEPEAAAADLQHAIDERLCVDIEYSRMWEQAVVRGRVHPLRLYQGVRGWELDALREDGLIRTFLVDRLRSVVITDERFTPPDDAEALLADQRRARTVTLNIPQRHRWVVDRYAEQSRALAEDDEAVTVEADFIPPVADRIRLVLTICGPEAFVVAPDDLVVSGADLAAELLAHHQL